LNRRSRRSQPAGFVGGREEFPSESVIAERSLRQFLPQRTVRRGDVYFVEGRVKRIEAVAPGVIVATVRAALVIPSR